MRNKTGGYAEQLTLQVCNAGFALHHTSDAEGGGTFSNNILT